MDELCALVVGHKKASPGAVNKSSGLTESTFNDHPSLHIEDKVAAVVTLINAWRR